MKFGKRLVRQAHAEWATFYLDYLTLKQELKQAVLFGDLQGLVWENMFQSELKKVNHFYLDKEAQLCKQLQELESAPEHFASQDSFGQFCRSLEVLRYYVVLNYMAVFKIVKKRTKMLKNASKMEYLAILMQQPFYTSIKLARITVKTELLALKIIPGAFNEQNYMCPICLDVLCNPVVLSCTHRFCWNCLSKSSERVQACPICRKDQRLDPSNLHIDWILKEFLHQQFPQSQVEMHTAREGLIQQLERRASNLGGESIVVPAPPSEPKVQECKYSILKMIGEGVFGEVYLAKHKENLQGPAVALKKLSKSHPKFRQVSVTKEISAGKVLQYPGIIHFEESFETASSIYLVMEYFPGKDLFTAMEDRDYKPYPEYLAKDIFLQVLSALAHCHERGIVHRDVKLENILMSEDGKTKLIDFGLCDFVMDSEQYTKPCFDSVGSPAYIAPEILTGKPYDGFKVDVWSFGVVLYTLLFGCFPFSAAQYKHLVNGEPLAVQFHNSGISDSAKQLIQSMLKVDPRTRASLEDVKNSEWLRDALDPQMVH